MSEAPVSEAEIKSAIENAIAHLFAHQPNLSQFTDQTGQSEWNLAQHLAAALSKFFPGLDCDVDVIKKHYGKRRPDIIFHKRGTHEANHLVVELKRDGSPKEIQGDIDKIKEHWFRAPLHYKFGAAINFCADGKHEIHVFENAT